jgi:hypothetical protein
LAIRLAKLFVVADIVPVKTVSSPAEAEAACGLLRSAGIECSYREANIAADAFWGWREILVGETTSQ